MKKYSLLIYLLFVHVILITLIVKYGVISGIVNKFYGSDQPSQFSHFYQTMVELHDRIDENLTKDVSIFIGDSITQGLAVSSISDNAVNFGIGNDTTQGVLNRLNNYLSLKRAKFVVLEIGINDLKAHSNEEITRNYKLIIDKLKTATKSPVVVNAIFLVDENATKLSYLKNNRVKLLNNKIEQLCEDQKQFHYLNINRKLLGKNQNLDPKYHIGDGLHLNAAGYAIWIEELRNLYKELTSH